ncbi:hypothetical protein [Mucilaginibacter defluvii]|uniref:Uncharacterized protein n=1 Tax=Mucilaginibacter defluvii TaxID=1196019 RepID=A0ABP9FTU4_9SPHI
MDSLTTAGNPGYSNDAAQEDANPQHQPSQGGESATNLENTEAGKATGTQQNNGYGNTPDEDEPVDPDLTKTED